EGFAHVVDREGCGSDGNQGFHLDTSLGSSHYVGAYLNAIFAQASGHINVREREWMTKRYPLGGALGGGDSSDTGDFEGIALGVFEAPDCAQDGRLHFDETLGDGGAGGDRFCRDIDHLDFAASGIVGQFGHRLSLATEGPSQKKPLQTRSILFKSLENVVAAEEGDGVATIIAAAGRRASQTEIGSVAADATV